RRRPGDARAPSSGEQRCRGGPLQRRARGARASVVALAALAVSSSSLGVVVVAGGLLGALATTAALGASSFRPRSFVAFLLAAYLLAVAEVVGLVELFGVRRISLAGSGVASPPLARSLARGRTGSGLAVTVGTRRVDVQIIGPPGREERWRWRRTSSDARRCPRPLEQW